MAKPKSRQRFRLGEKYGKGEFYYHATFDHITHKVNRQKKKIPVVLLKDIYFVNKDGKRVLLAKSNDFRDKNGRHIVAEHIWVKLTKPWFSLPCELVTGDEVTFSAEVEKYKINRDDIVKKREKIWQAAVKKNDEIHKRWVRYTNKHYRKNFELSLRNMKRKQRNNLKIARQKQENLELVDYSLNKIKHVKLVKKIKSARAREQYDYHQYKKQGYKYSAWLAARSINKN